MAANLARAGFAVTAWNRTGGRAPELEELASPPPSRRRTRPQPATSWSSACPTRRTSRPSCSASAASSRGLAPGPWSSIARRSPRRAAGTFAARLRERGLRLVDAPVSGGSEGARNATLTIFVGGDEATWSTRGPSSTRSADVTHVGPIGAGQAVKAVNQVILAGTYLASPKASSSRSRPASTSSRSSGARRGRGPELGARQPERPDARERLTRSASRSSCTARTSHRAGARRAGRGGAAGQRLARSWRPG
jgi:hypothetical protein